MATYLGSFGGGKDIIPFGWDFAVIFAISWLIFELAKRCGLEAEQSKKHLEEANTHHSHHDDSAELVEA